MSPLVFGAHASTLVFPGPASPQMDSSLASSLPSERVRELIRQGVQQILKLIILSRGLQDWSKPLWRRNTCVPLPRILIVGRSGEPFDRTICIG